MRFSSGRQLACIVNNSSAKHIITDKMTVNSKDLGRQNGGDEGRRKLTATGFERGT